MSKLELMTEPEWDAETDRLLEPLHEMMEHLGKVIAEELKTGSLEELERTKMLRYQLSELEDHKQKLLYIRSEQRPFRFLLSHES